MLALILLSAALTLGAHLPALPVIGTLGAAALSWFGLLIVVLMAACAIVEFRGRRHHRAAMVLAAIAALSAVFGATIVGAQWQTATAKGIAIDPLRALYPGPVPRVSGEPELATYHQAFGQDLPVQIMRATAKATRPAPVLVYVHGGAWTGGVYWMRNHDLRWFADQGMVVVALEYSLSTPKRHLWNVAENQVGCGLAWVKANIARFGGDPTRVALMGESAGGNLVINAAYRARNGTLKPSCAGALPPISAVIANYPAVDLGSIYRPEPAGGAAASYVGGPPSQFPERYAAIAANTHLRPDSPPTFLILGEADRLVPPAPTYAFAKRAREMGVPLELIAVPFGGHVFDFMAGSVPNQLFRQATLRFLARHGIHPAIAPS
jgi:acetyl esterase